MPTYEYHCNKCETNFEVEQRMTDDALKVHEDCGGDLVKVFSSVGIVWKGGGFYKTDARSKSSTSTPKEKKTETKTESKSSGETKNSTKKDNSTGSK